MSAVLWSAALYNLASGAFIVLFPFTLFHWAGMPEPNYPMIWQSVGMIVGVYGIGYGCAATNPYRHWPIVLVGFLGKLFGPIGFVVSAFHGQLPWVAGMVNVTNDLIWLIPFAFILRGAYLNSHPPSH